MSNIAIAISKPRNEEISMNMNSNTLRRSKVSTSTSENSHSMEREKEHLDGKAKRMQMFLKKIARSKNPLPIHSPFKVDHNEKNEKSFSLERTPDVVVTSVEKNTGRSELELLKQYEKEVKSALTYYGVIVQKGFNQKLPGTATAVLESIINAERILEVCLRNIMEMKEFAMDAEDVVKNGKVELYHSITDLIRVSDDVLFDPSHNAYIDKKAAANAAQNVTKTLSNLYEYVIPRITKYSVNAELLQCSSSNSSSTSLDTLDNIAESEMLDNSSCDDSLRSADTLLSVQTRDSGFVSEMTSDYPSDTSLSVSDYHQQPCPRKRLPCMDQPPPKPPLPSSNRSFYGNMNIAQGIRHTVSQPDDLSVFKRRDLELERFKAQRPISEMSGSSGCLNSSLGSASNRSSKSSLSSCGSLNQNKTGILEVPNDIAFAPISIKRRIDSQSDKQVLNSTIDHEEIGISDENYTNIQKHTDKYELLARSSLCLCPGNGDEEDLLSEETPPPPLLPKKKLKHTVDNYLNIIDGYDVRGYHEGRPSSFYDNFPLPNVHNITEDEIMNGEDLPKLPPKRGSYNRSVSVDEPPVSPSRSLRGVQTLNTRGEKKPRSRRESTETYREENIVALDSKTVTRFLSFKESDDGPLLCGGTIDALIVHGADVPYNSLYYKAFIATYRTFVSPPELICKLLYRANRFQDSKHSTTNISRNSLRLLVDVIDEVFEELDKSLFAQLRSQVHRLLNQGELGIAKDLRDRIVNYCIKIEVNPMPIYQPEKSESDLFEFKSTELAQQMCVLDTDYFVKIELPEVLRWAKEQSETLSPNLSRFIGHFNNMSFWVRTLVIKEHRQQEREKIYKKFLKIMRILRKLNNFSSFLAIMSALDSTPVRRLEWPKQFTEQLAEDTKLIDSESAFKIYRETLAEAKPPCIPYLGLILTDITFIHLGNPQHLPDGKVNFLKRWQQYNLLDSVRRFKESLYNFPRNEKILDFFNEYDDHLGEDALWEESLILRPRGK